MPVLEISSDASFADDNDTDDIPRVFDCHVRRTQHLERTRQPTYRNSFLDRTDGKRSQVFSDYSETCTSTPRKMSSFTGITSRHFDS